MTFAQPLALISDEELQARIDRFVDHAVTAEASFEAYGDADDHIASEHAWLSVRALVLEQAKRRTRISPP